MINVDAHHPIDGSGDAVRGLFRLGQGVSRLFASAAERLRRRVGDRPVDIARQLLNVAGAIFQIGTAALAGAAIARISDENRTLVVPAGYAFAIWGPIYALSIAYAAYQALPSTREDPLLRRVGWWTAAAFAGSGARVPLFAARRFALAQIAIVAIAACLAVAFLRVARETGGRELGRGERWLVAPTIGLYFGWLTAAALVGLATTGVALGLAADGRGAALGGGALLLLGGGLATAVLVAARRGPATGAAAYAAAVVWSLVAVAVDHRQESWATTGAAVVAAGMVVVALLGSVSAGPHRHRPARAMSADAA